MPPIDSINNVWTACDTYKYHGCGVAEGRCEVAVAHWRGRQREAEDTINFLIKSCAR